MRISDWSSDVCSSDLTVRVDSGVEEGGEISMFYDPMIAKLVAGGTDRPAAIAHMRAALDAFYIRGISHNIRSEERRVGKEGVSPWRCRWSQSHDKHNKPDQKYIVMYEQIKNNQ